MLDWLANMFSGAGGAAAGAGGNLTGMAGEILQQPQTTMQGMNSLFGNPNLIRMLGETAAAVDNRNADGQTSWAGNLGQAAAQGAQRQAFSQYMQSLADPNSAMTSLKVTDPATGQIIEAKGTGPAPASPVGTTAAPVAGAQPAPAQPAAPAAPGGAAQSLFRNPTSWDALGLPKF